MVVHPCLIALWFNCKKNPKHLFSCEKRFYFYVCNCNLKTALRNSKVVIKVICRWNWQGWKNCFIHSKDIFNNITFIIHQPPYKVTNLVCFHPNCIQSRVKLVFFKVEQVVEDNINFKAQQFQGLAISALKCQCPATFGCYLLQHNWIKLIVNEHAVAKPAGMSLR